MKAFTVGRIAASTATVDRCILRSLKRTAMACRELSYVSALRYAAEEYLRGPGIHSTRASSSKSRVTGSYNRRTTARLAAGNGSDLRSASPPLITLAVPTIGAGSPAAPAVPVNATCC